MKAGKAIKIIIFFVLTLFSLSIAQNNNNNENDKKNEQEFQVIPVIEIPQKIEQVYNFLGNINKIEIPSTDIDKTEKELNKLLKEIELLKKDTKEDRLKNITVKKLKDFRTKWEADLEELETFKITLEEASARLDDEKTKLNDILKYWDFTYKNAKKEKAPKQLLKRLVTLKKDITKTENQLHKILSRILSARDKLSVEELYINETITKINKQIEQNRSLIFSFDSPPLWTAILDTTSTTEFAQNYEKSVERIHNAFVEFWDMYSEEFYYYLFFFTIVLIIILYLKFFSKKIITDEIKNDEKFSVKILERPVSVAILITIYFAHLFFPLASSVISEIIKILLILPLLVLFPTFIAKVSRKPLYFITIIYLLNQITEISLGTSIYVRIFVLILTGLMIIGLYLIVKIDTTQIPEQRVKTTKTLIKISKLLIVILILAAAGNILGNTALSYLIFYGVMRTIYISLLIITALQIFYTLITIGIETKPAKMFLVVQKNGQELKTKLFKFAKIAAIIFWTYKFLESFEMYESVSKNITDFLTTPIEIGEISFALLNILLFFVTIWISVKLSQLIRFFFDNEVAPRVQFPRGVPAAISLMLKYSIITFGFLLALFFIGFDIEQFAIVAGALGVGIGFGMQNIVNNFISGLILLFERPIQVGDTISLTNLIGTVKRIGIRSSIIKTFEGSEVIVPNADLISGQVINWTLSDKLRRIEIKIGVHFNAPPEKVMEILNKALEDRDDILSYPAPYILYKGHDENRQNFDLRFWTANNDNWIFIRSAVLLKITRMLQDEGIEIPYQQHNVYIKENDKKIIKD